MPRSKVRRKKKLALATLVVLVILSPVVIAYTLYGLSIKPMVDYTFGGDGDVRLSYRLSASTLEHPGTIDIVNVLIRNRGRTDFSVIVTLHAVNAQVSTSYYGPYSDMASEQILVPANASYRVVTFYLTLIIQASSFAIWCDVSRTFDFSTLSSAAATTFGEITPIPPTHLEYSQESTSPYDYHLAQPP